MLRPLKYLGGLSKMGHRSIMLNTKELNDTDENLLIAQLEYVLRTSPFYQQKYQQDGVDLNSAQSAQDFASLPYTTKQEILEEQSSYPPFGRISKEVVSADLRRIHSTSGSTGRPAYIALTQKDLDATMLASSRAFTCAGLTPEDTVIHCLNYCMWSGGLTDHLGLEATGATVIPYGVGNSKKLIETILEIKPTAISCTPSYLARLEFLLREEFNMIPVDLGLKKAFLGGEGGLQDPLVRQKIEQSWGLRAIDANYGMSDVLSIFGSECEHRQGLHFHGRGILHFEMIDPENGDLIPVADGRVGEMVLTHLTREAQPLLRYRTGDLVKIISTFACTCGRDSFRFLVVGRADDMITVRGINVYPGAVQKVITSRSDFFSGEFQIVLNTPPPHDKLELRVEVSAQVLATQFEEIGASLKQAFQQELSFSPEIILIPYGEFPRTEGKTRRVMKVYKE